jgi:hypothetical protein
MRHQGIYIISTTLGRGAAQEAACQVGSKTGREADREAPYKVGSKAGSEAGSIVVRERQGER